MSTGESMAPLRPTLGPAQPRNWPFWFAATCLVFALAPFAILHAQFLWLREHYEFFPLVLIGSAILGWDALKYAGPLQPGTWRRSLALVGLSWILLSAAILMVSPWLGAVASLITMLALIHGLGGMPLVRTLFPAWAFLWLVIPPPLGFDNALILILQRTVTRINGSLLDLLGIRYYLDGNIVVVAGRHLMVGKTCSGVLSLLTILACTTFFIFWNRLSLLRGIPLLLAALAWDFLGNIVRVLAIVVLYSYAGIDASSGLTHEALGFVVFVVTLGLIASTDACLLFLISFARAVTVNTIDRVKRLRHRVRWNPLDDVYGGDVYGEDHTYSESSQTLVEPPVSPVPAPRPLNRATWPAFSATWMAAWPIVAIYGVLGLATVVLSGPSITDLFRVPGFVSSLNGLGLDSLPAHEGAFERQRFENMARDSADRSADFTRAWYYVWKGKSVAIVVNYPFRGWHDLAGCYRLEDWQVSEVALREPGPAADAANVVEADLVRADGRHGHLLFGLFDERGTPIKPTGELDEPPGAADSRLPARIVRRLVRSPLPLSVQIQLFVEADRPLTSAEAAETREFFLHIRSILKKRLERG